MFDCYRLLPDKTVQRINSNLSAQIQTVSTSLWLTEVGGDCSVSTVFLSLDHRVSTLGPPILFETMAFGGPSDQFQRRYATWCEARDGHQELVSFLRSLDTDCKVYEVILDDYRGEMPD